MDLRDDTRKAYVYVIEKEKVGDKWKNKTYRIHLILQAGETYETIGNDIKTFLKFKTTGVEINGKPKAE
jgi:hypothetical protein